MVLGSLPGIAVEILQLTARLGMLELDDWLLNTMGAVLEYLLHRKLFPQTPWVRRWDTCGTASCSRGNSLRANANQTETISPNQLWSEP